MSGSSNYSCKFFLCTILFFVSCFLVSLSNQIKLTVELVCLLQLERRRITLSKYMYVYLIIVVVVNLGLSTRWNL